MRKTTALLFLLVLSTACGGGGVEPPGSGGSPGAGGSAETGGQAAVGGTAAGGSGSGGIVGTGGAAVTGGSVGDGGTAAGGTSTGGAASGGSSGGMEWLPSWATTIQRTEAANKPSMSLAENTLRQFVWPTVSGTQIRIQLSNERGNGPVDIAQVHVANAAAGDPLDNVGGIDTATAVSLTFDGMPGVTIPVGETAWSDPVDFQLQELQLTAISMQFGTAVPSDITGHPGARTKSYIAAGDVVASASISGEMKERWYFINAIEVMAPADAFAIALLGDSITDGYGTVLNDFARVTDFLTLALKEDSMLQTTRSVLNFGMGANTLTGSVGGDQDPGTVRFERDVLPRDKIKWLIIMEGVNDINAGVQAGTITGAYQGIIDQAEAKGIEVFVSPLTPMNAQNSPTRGTVNDWIRASQSYDAGVDFDLAIRDPNNPNNTQAQYKNDDLHPSRAGYQAMAESVDLTLFYP